VHAALTGHLLLTTLHTNSAAGAVARLLEMGVEPYLLASVLRGVLAQRLVGALCRACKEGQPPTPEERAFYDDATMAPPEALFRGKGCAACAGMGFTGRIGIVEFLDSDEQQRELIRGRAPTQAVLARAIEAGMRTMYMDGLAKAAAGVTTLEEVCRVTEEW